jgi:hypothetical protein
MAPTQTRWQISGDYFENCNCDVLCPCLASPSAPLTAKPTQGACEVAFGFHVESGSYGEVRLDGLNAAMIARTPGPMAEGNWTVALYVDERGNAAQREALQAIFSGAAGGVMGGFAPLIGTVLGVKAAPITFEKDGRRRSVEIPRHDARGHPGPAQRGTRRDHRRQSAPLQPGGCGAGRGRGGQHLGRLWDALGQFGEERALRADPVVQRLALRPFP